MMKRHCRYITLLMVWLFTGAIPIETYAQKREYRTDLLRLIAEKTDILYQIDTLANGVYEQYAQYKTQPITVIIEDGRVTHIGYTIFASVQREGLGKNICNFIERYCLELSIPTIEHFTAPQRMKEDGVITTDGMLNPAYLQSLCQDTTICINIQTIDNRGYTIGWRKGEQWKQKISFPIEYDLIFGVDMEEREKRLPEELFRYTVRTDNDTLPRRDELKKAWQDNYYTLKGGAYLMDNLNANQYFEIDKSDKFIPIYNKVYPIESLANLMTTNLISNDYILDISFRKYGFKTDTINVPLKTWIGYCKGTGCKPYFGIISLDENTAVCELVMHNNSMGYNHIMKLSFPMDNFESRKGRIKARLNSYVTSSRIKSLFDEFDSNTK